MRTVFSNNYEVAHVWAHQQQYSGRTSNGHFFFEGDTIYSYGHHFACGRVVKNRHGDTAYITNFDRYSSSTGKHQALVLGAIPTGEKIFEVPGCWSPNKEPSDKYVNGYKSGIEGVMHYLIQIEGCISKQSRARTADYRMSARCLIVQLRDWIQFWELDRRHRWSTWNGWKMQDGLSNILTRKNAEFFLKHDLLIEYSTEQLTKAIEIYKCLCHFGFMGECLPSDSNVLINKIMEKYLGSDVFNRIEENRKKEEILERKRREKRKKQAIEESFESLEKWHNDEQAFWSPSWEFIQQFGWHTALKVSRDGSYVQTSKAIKIEIPEARRLWKIVKMFHEGHQFMHQIVVDKNGSKWAFNKYENDVLVAGCHQIPYREMEAIAKQLNF